MQDTFARISQSVTRVMAAGLLLTPPKHQVLPPERACSAVSTLLYLVVALIPTLILLHSEVGPPLPPCP